MLRRYTSLTVFVFISFASVVACSQSVLIADGAPESPTPPASFVDPDAGASLPDANELRAYCPSDRCPAGHTTCPNSFFLCDVDLRTDPNNCGECGNACPASGRLEEYICVEGRCQMICTGQGSLDCDGIPDNGCETMLPNNDHCGVCGLKCPADKPCIDRMIYGWGCGCRTGEIYCASPVAPCVDPRYDDDNCGACNNKCPPEGDGGELPPNTYSGCWDSACGTLKCNWGYGNCDSDSANGCEESVLTDENCGLCGVKCTGGAKCRLTPDPLRMPVCMCAEGLTFCGGVDYTGLEKGECKDLSFDNYNCGTCGQSCHTTGLQNASESCVYGKCVMNCMQGWADCNGDRRDDCETNIAADPKNCGACGNVCDGIAGQACVDGRCLVEPCDVLEDGGGPTR